LRDPYRGSAGQPEGDRRRGPWDPLRPAPTFRLRDTAGARQRRDEISRRTWPAPSRFVTAQSGLPPMMVRCVAGAVTRLPSRHRCCVLPTIASATMGPATAPDGAVHG
jgi:hypothetical protein